MHLPGRLFEHDQRLQVGCGLRLKCLAALALLTVSVHRLQELPPGPAAPLLLRLLQNELVVDRGVRAAALRVLTKAMVTATSDVVCEYPT